MRFTPKKVRLQSYPIHTFLGVAGRQHGGLDSHRIPYPATPHMSQKARWGEERQGHFPSTPRRQTNLVVTWRLPLTQWGQGGEVLLTVTLWGHFLTGTGGWVTHSMRKGGSVLSAPPPALYLLWLGTNLGCVPSQMGHYPSPPKLGPSRQPYV